MPVLNYEVTVLFKERVKQYIPKKHKCFGIKVFKLRDMNGYTCNMNVYLGKDRQSAAQTMIFDILYKQQ
jgi:hypothetical protein